MPSLLGFVTKLSRVHTELPCFVGSRPVLSHDQTNEFDHLVPAVWHVWRACVVSALFVFES